MKRHSSSIIRLKKKRRDSEKNFTKERRVKRRTSNMSTGAAEVILLGEIKAGEGEGKGGRGGLGFEDNNNDNEKHF